MAKRAGRQPSKSPARLSRGDIEAALPKLRRRLAEFEAFDPAAMTDTGAPEEQALVDKLDHTLADVFGVESLEYGRYYVSSLYAGGSSIGFYGDGPSRQAIVNGYKEGKEIAVSKLRTCIDVLEEQLEEITGGAHATVPRSIEGWDIHPAIEAAAGQLYRDGHYANAIENACKALNNLVQTKSGIYEVDNTDLMRRAFSRKAPKLAFNDLADDTKLGEQEGMMHLYEGAFMAFRNPRAHRIVTDDPEMTIGALLTISFLAKMLDRVSASSKSGS